MITLSFGKRIGKLLIFVRPWDVEFLLELEKRLTTFFKPQSVEFATFFWSAAREVRKAGYSCVYLPQALSLADESKVSDEELAELDHRLAIHTGAGLRMMLIAERFLPKTQKEQQRFLKKHFFVLRNMIWPRTICISSAIDHFVYWLAFGLVRIFDGVFFGLAPTGYPRGCAVAFEDPWNIWPCPSVRGSCGSHNSMPDEVASVIKHTKPDYCVKLPGIPLTRRFLSRARRLLDDFNDFRYKSYFSSSNPLGYVPILGQYKKIVPFVRSVVARQVFFRPSSMSRFRAAIFVPLHFQPEASSLVYSPWLLDQLEMLRLISQASPLDVTILVKEHFAMEGKRPLGFYKMASQIPGVIWAMPQENSADLINRCECVISLAGTAALEAAMLGKRALVFGRPYFRMHPSIREVISLRNLHEDILWALGAKKDYEFDEEDVDSDSTKLELSDSVIKGTYSLLHWSPKMDRRVVRFDNKNVNAFSSFIIETVKRVNGTF